MATLTVRQRRALPKEDFAIPEKAPGPGSYPIPDRNHAIDALSRVEHYGTTEERHRVRTAVHRKYPTLGATVKRHGADVVVIDHTGHTGRRIGSRAVTIRRRRSAA